MECLKSLEGLGAHTVPHGKLPVEESAERSHVRTAWYVALVSSEVDVTLIQETLALTPQQRIQQNDRTLQMIHELRDGLAKSRKPARDTSDE
jgi:hypothetical protein